MLPLSDSRKIMSAALFKFTLIILLLASASNAEEDCTDFDNCVLQNSDSICKFMFGADNPCAASPTAGLERDGHSTTTRTTTESVDTTETGTSTGATTTEVDDDNVSILDVNMNGLNDTMKKQLIGGDMLIGDGNGRIPDEPIDANVALDAYMHNRNDLTDNIEELIQMMEGGMMDSGAEFRIGEKLQLGALKDSRARWPGGIVYYEIVNGHFTSSHRQKILRAMRDLESKTCIRFRERRHNTQNYVQIFSGDGCFAHAGRMWNWSRQHLSLGVRHGCVTNSVIQHELMHTLGFMHEQARYDRDQYITVHWNNVVSNPYWRRQFDKLSPRDIDLLGVPYEYGSVMHYESTAASRNGRPTMTSKRGSNRLGNRYGATDSDVRRINCYYRCPQGCYGSGKGGNGGGTTSRCRNHDYNRLCRKLKSFCNYWPGSAFHQWMRRTCKRTCFGCR